MEVRTRTGRIIEDVKGLEFSHFDNKDKDYAVIKKGSADEVTVDARNLFHISGDGFTLISLHQSYKGCCILEFGLGLIREENEGMLILKDKPSDFEIVEIRNLLKIEQFGENFENQSCEYQLFELGILYGLQQIQSWIWSLKEFRYISDEKIREKRENDIEAKKELIDYYKNNKEPD